MENELDDLCFDMSEFQRDLFDVQDALEQASVDARGRKIIWHDRTRLTIEDAARRIHAESGVDYDIVQSHVVGWLEMDYEPEGLDETQMEEFEQLIERWISPYDGIR